MYVGPIRKTNPDGSFSIAYEAELERIQKKIERLSWSQASVIPKGMTSDDYQNMCILPGNRIGWQQKQEHLHQLSDLYTLGYLTEEEYDKRAEWVNNAQTIEQVNVVFTDLRKDILTTEAGGYLKPAVKDSGWVSFWTFIITGILVATYIQLAIMGAWGAELVMIMVTVIILEAINVAGGKKKRKRT